MKKKEPNLRYYHFIWLFLFLFFTSSQSVAIQTADPELDSLLQVLKTQPEDTNKVITLITVIRKYVNINPQKALIYGKQALKLSRDLRYFHGEMDATSRICYAHKKMGNLDSALIYIRKYIDMGESVNDFERMAKGYLQFGNLVRVRGEFEIAHSSYSKALVLFRDVGNIKGELSCYNSMGNIFQSRSEFDSAAFYYLKTMELADSIGMESALGSIMLNLGKVFIFLKDFDKAREYNLKSIEYSTRFGNNQSVALANANLGIIEFEQKNYSQALEYYRKALSINQNIQSRIGINNQYINIAGVYREQGKYTQALEYYNKALGAYKEMDYKAGILAASMNIATVYTEQGKYSQALKMYDYCLKLSLKIDDKMRRKDLYLNTYYLFIELGDSRKANEYHELYMALNDSIYQIEKEKTVAALELKYERKKDQARILWLERENLTKELDLSNRTIQRNIYMFIGSGIVLFFIFFFSYYSQRTRKNRIINEQRIQQLEEEKKLLAARSIVEGQEEERKRIAKELHDGLGVLLSSAKMHFTTIRDKDPKSNLLIDKAAKLLEQATGDVRRISHNMMPGLLTKYGLYEAVEELFEQVDEVEELHAKVHIEGEQARLKENTEIMLYRIIQEMVNNTLKHAEAKHIRLDIQIQPDRLVFNYSDDGKGFDFAEKIKSKSLGLTSIQSRVKFLSGELDVKTGTGDGVRYVFEIPNG